VGSTSPSYRGHRYPVEVISHCVWLYFRFPLSFREVEELMLQRGVIASYETEQRQPRPCGTPHLRRAEPTAASPGPGNQGIRRARLGGLELWSSGVAGLLAAARGAP
jgi:hypothetical protein